MWNSTQKGSPGVARLWDGVEGGTRDRKRGKRLNGPLGSCQWLVFCTEHPRATPPNSYSAKQLACLLELSYLVVFLTHYTISSLRAGAMPYLPFDSQH